MSVNWALMTAGSLKFVSISYQSTDVIVEKDTTPTIWATVRVSVCVCVCVFVIWGCVFRCVCLRMHACVCVNVLSLSLSLPMHACV